MGTEMKRALLFGSVPCGDGAFLRPYLDGGGWTVFCADGGVRNARAAGLRPDYLIAVSYTHLTLPTIYSV